MLLKDGQLDTTEEVTIRAIDLIPEGEQHKLCHGHRVLGDVYRPKGATEEATHNFEVALEIAISLNTSHDIFWIHLSLAGMFTDESRFNDAHSRIKHAKSHAVNDTYILVRASWLRARCWEEQRMFEDAKSEASRALDVFEKFGATDDAEGIRGFLRRIDGMFEEKGSPVASGEVGADSELLATMQPIIYVNSSYSDGITESG